MNVDAQEDEKLWKILNDKPWPTQTGDKLSWSPRNHESLEIFPSRTHKTERKIL